MKIYKQKLGKMGEDIACGYLKKEGYKIVKRNIVLGNGEIDVICKLRGVLIIVEVRTKRKGLFYLPVETVGFRKISKLLELMDEYCMNIEYTGVCRIDVVGVQLSKDNKGAEIRHYKGIT